jgi:hypothetical protein
MKSITKQFEVKSKPEYKRIALSSGTVAVLRNFPAHRRRQRATHPPRSDN